MSSEGDSTGLVAAPCVLPRDMAWWSWGLGLEPDRVKFNYGFVTSVCVTMGKSSLSLSVLSVQWQNNDHPEEVVLRSKG